MIPCPRCAELAAEVERLKKHDAEVRAEVWNKVELAVYGEYHGPYDTQGVHDCERCETISEVLAKLKKAREAEEKAK